MGTVGTMCGSAFMGTVVLWAINVEVLYTDSLGHMPLS